MINTVRHPAPSYDTTFAALLSEQVYEHAWPSLPADPEAAFPIATLCHGEFLASPWELYVSIPLQRNLWGSVGQQNILLRMTYSTCWIAFEGTARPETWLYNVDGVSPIAFGKGPTLVHPGFFNLMLEVLNGLLRPDFEQVCSTTTDTFHPPILQPGNSLLHAIAELYRQRGCPPKVIWTGHSAGAALANLTAAWLLGGNVPLLPRDHPFLKANHQVIDFGCPRFIHSCSPSPALPVNRERHAHVRDLVPHVPIGLSWNHWGTGNYLWGPRGQLYQHPILVHHSLQILMGNALHYLTGILTGTLLRRILNNHAASTYRRFIFPDKSVISGRE